MFTILTVLGVLNLLIDSTIKATVLLFFAFVVDRTFARSRPTISALLWDKAMLGLLFIPMASLFVPELQFPILAAASTPLHFLPVDMYSANTAVDAPAVLQAQNISSARFHWDWSVLVVGVYCLGFGFLMLRIGVGFFKVSSLRQKITRCQNEAHITKFRYWCRYFNIKQAIDLGISSAIDVPTVIGWRRPLVVIPESLAEQRPEMLESIMIHELAHVKRKDALWNLLAKIVGAIYWCHPLVYVAQHELEVAREYACDDWAIKAVGSTDRYASMLLDVASLVTGRRLVLGVDFFRPRNILDRSERIINLKEEIEPGANRLVCGFLSVSVLVLSMVLGVLHPVQSTDKRQIKPEDVGAPKTSNNKDTSALFRAAAGGELSDVEAIVNAGADVDGSINGGPTALMVAAQDGHINIVRFLLRNGADVNAMSKGGGATPLIVACTMGHIEIVKMLIEKGANVNLQKEGRRSALVQAAIGGHVEIVNILLEEGANVRVVGGRGFTALMAASFSGKKEIFRAFVERGAGEDVNLNRLHGQTALSLATMNGHTEIVNDLLALGADINAVMAKDYTLLMMAATSGNIALLQTLKEKGMDFNLNAQTTDGRTALMLAARMGRKDMVNELLRLGADKNVQDEKGNTALFWANEKGHIDVADILEAF